MRSDQSIAQQISTVSKLLIAGLALLSVLAVAATLFIRTVFVEYRETARTTLVGNGILEDVLEGRMAALKWRLSEDQAHVDEFRDNIRDLREVDSNLPNIAGDASMLVTGTAELATDLSAYEGQFLAILEARDIYNTTEEVLTASGLAARRALTDIMTTAYGDGDVTAAFYAGRAQEALMLGRFYLERYRRTESEADLDRSVEEMSNAQEQMRLLLPELQNPQRRDWANSVIEQISVFVENKAVLSAAVRDQMAAREIMDTLGPKIVADVEAVIDNATERQNTLGPRGELASLITFIAICAAAFLTILFGWRTSSKMSKRISHAIAESVDTMSRIADGDLDAEVGHADQENEIGRMARALQVFKQNGKEALAAAQREKEAERSRQEATKKLDEEKEAQKEAARVQAEAARKAMITELSASLGQVVKAASEGDFTQRVDARFEDQELNALADAVNSLVVSVENSVASTSTCLERIAQGDLNSRIEGEFRGVFNQLQTNTNQMIDALRSLLGDISASTTTVGASSDELRETSNALSKQAEQNAASVEETSAALEELTVSIKQVGQNVSEANSNAKVVNDVARSSSKVAAEAADAMNTISDATSEITSVVSVINDISFQINLLALNAGVEAARAGEAGAGFSVVASEVRQLAQRAGEAASEIDQVIGRSNQAVAAGVEKVTNAQASLNQISESVLGVSERVEQIAQAISEQIGGIDEINNAVVQIDTNTQKQAAAFEEVTAASAVLSKEAKDLEKSAARFELDPEVRTSKENTEADARATKEAKRVPQTFGNVAHDIDSWEEF